MKYTGPVRVITNADIADIKEHINYGRVQIGKQKDFTGPDIKSHYRSTKLPDGSIVESWYAYNNYTIKVVLPNRPPVEEEVFIPGFVYVTATDTYTYGFGKPYSGDDAVFGLGTPDGDPSRHRYLYPLRYKDNKIVWKNVIFNGKAAKTGGHDYGLKSWEYIKTSDTGKQEILGYLSYRYSVTSSQPFLNTYSIDSFPEETTVLSTTDYNEIPGDTGRRMLTTLTGGSSTYFGGQMIGEDWLAPSSDVNCACIRTVDGVDYLIRMKFNYQWEVWSLKDKTKVHYGEFDSPSIELGYSNFRWGSHQVSFNSLGTAAICVLQTYHPVTGTLEQYQYKCANIIARYDFTNIATPTVAYEVYAPANAISTHSEATSSSTNAPSNSLDWVLDERYMSSSASIVTDTWNLMYDMPLSAAYTIDDEETILWAEYSLDLTSNDTTSGYAITYSTYIPYELFYITEVDTDTGSAIGVESYSIRFHIDGTTLFTSSFESEMTTTHDYIATPETFYDNVGTATENYTSTFEMYYFYLIDLKNSVIGYIKESGSRTYSAESVQSLEPTVHTNTGSGSVTFDACLLQNGEVNTIDSTINPFSYTSTQVEPDPPISSGTDYLHSALSTHEDYFYDVYLYGSFDVDTISSVPTPELEAIFQAQIDSSGYTGEIELGDCEVLSGTWENTTCGNISPFLATYRDFEVFPIATTKTLAYDKGKDVLELGRITLTSVLMPVWSATGITEYITQHYWTDADNSLADVTKIDSGLRLLQTGLI